MLVKFLREWHGHRVGTSAEIPPGVAEGLIRRGIAEASQDREPAAHENKRARPQRKKG